MQDTASLIDRGLQLQRQGNLDEAARIYHEVLAKDANSAHAYHLLGTIALRRRDYAKARELIERAIAIDGSNPIFYNNLGEVFVALWKGGEAFNCYLKATKLAPKFAEAFVGLGKVLKLMLETDQAIANFQRAIALRPDYLEAQSELAQLYVEQKQLDKAVAICHGILSKNDRFAPAYKVLGSAFFTQGRLDDAIAQYQRALQLDPAYAEAAWNLATALNAKALELQGRAVATKPTAFDPTLHLQYAKNAVAAGKLDEAIACYQHLVKVLPDNAEVFCELGAAFGRKGDINSALQILQQAVSLNPNYPRARVNLGSTLGMRGDLEGAKAEFLRAIELNPNYGEAYLNLGALLLMQAETSGEAIGHLEKAVMLSPNSAEAHYRLADAYLLQMQVERATPMVQRALVLNPELAEAYDVYGRIFLALADVEGAKKQFIKALQLKPNYVKALAALGSAHSFAGEFEEALKVYDRVLEMSPQYLNAIAAKAAIFEKQKQYQAAYDLLSPYLKQTSLAEVTSHREALALVFPFCEVCLRLKRQDEAIALLEHLLAAQPNLMEMYQQEIYFNLGRLYDSIEEYDKAFANFSRGNSFRQSFFDRDQTVREFDDLMGFFTRDRLQALPRATHTSELPVFVLGMPRSGTTLVEQILDSHPHIVGAGELGDIGYAARGMPAMLRTDAPFPQCVSLLTPETLNDMADAYLAKLRQVGGAGAQRVVDKMPHNFRYLGLIALMLPQARIIHCKRHPLDTCLSCYFQNFTIGHSYKYDLENLGFYYKLYERLMQHWREVIDLPILEVQYEDMVADQEGMSRKLVEFLGLEWDEACLSFYQSERYAKTASYNQVRQPIYNKSVQRFRHYEHHLGPLKAALGMA